MDVSQRISIESVQATIRVHRSHGTFLEGDQFIRSLPRHISSVTSIAIEIAQLYLVQGQFILAAQACEDVSTMPGEEAIVLELLQAFIGIGRYSKLKTALRIARRIGDAWEIEVAGRPPTKAGDTTHVYPREDETARLSRRLQDTVIGRARVPDPPLTEYRVSTFPHYPGAPA